MDASGFVSGSDPRDRRIDYGGAEDVQVPLVLTPKRVVEALLREVDLAGMLAERAVLAARVRAALLPPPKVSPKV